MSDAKTDTEVILLGGEELPGGLEGQRYEAKVIHKDARQGPRRGRVQKESTQAEPGQQDMLRWRDPRISVEDLLYFYDVSTWHKRCVLLKTRLVGGLGWQLVTDDEDKAPDDAHQAITAFLDDPQQEREDGEPKRSFDDLVERYLIDYYATGNGYWEAPRQRAGDAVAEIYHLRAQEARRAADLSEGYYQVRGGTEKAHFAGWGDTDADLNEVLHFECYDPQDPYYGAPEWLTAMGAALLDRTAVEYNTNLFRNGLVAHFAVVVEGGKLSDKQIDALKQFLNENAKGVDNAGRGLVLQNEGEDVTIKIESLNVGFEKMKFGEGRDRARDEIIAAHGVLPRMVGVMEAGQLGGGGEMENQKRAFKESIIDPDQRKLERFINATILDSFGEHKWRLKFNEMDITDRQADGEYYERALDSEKGWMRREEVREREELPREEDEEDVIEKALESPGKTADLFASIRKALEVE